MMRVYIVVNKHRIITFIYTMWFHADDASSGNVGTLNLKINERIPFADDACKYSCK